jgi:hypothetical protein
MYEAPDIHMADLGRLVHFQLASSEITKAVSGATVQETWYIIGGHGPWTPALRRPHEE